MILIRLDIRNPLVNRFKTVFSRKGPLLGNKKWEIEVNKTSDVVEFEFRVSTRQSHAGVFLAWGLLGWELTFSVYDQRHWDYVTETWRKD